ncbi:Crp/Fnr family transcriptional regulator [Bacillus testis]|uniref:Crp/Fnr family transcriptional regulator n=1 Tax=Bacillus testis TaxID=1622072 RepID=UPI00067F6220|nr:Crp/Fnr family transcriptional regulator [Bacillus testis]
MDCSQCNGRYCMSSVPIFQGLNNDEMAELSKIIIHRTYKKGEPVFLAGDLNNHLFVVRKGKVKITRVTEEGHEQVIRIIQEGDFFGDLSLFRNNSLTSNAEAIELTEICLVKGEEFKKTLEKSPSLMLNMLDQLSERLEKAEFQLSQFNHRDVAQRVAAFILQHGENSENLIFEFPTNKTDIASMLGTTRETLSRKLSFFQRKGYIKISGRQIQICDVKALKELF